VRGLWRLAVSLLALSVVCFVVAAVTYEPPPTGWTSYTPLSRGPEAGTDHWPWISAGAAFLISALAAAATGWAERRRGR
jgi:heme/copper-type cytochrome/quinol oxidase subunit 1